MYKVNINWNICRICLGEEENIGELNNIFDTDRDNVEISYKINQCGGVNVKKDVNLPDLICRKCLAYLNVSYKFRKICQDSEEKLQQFLKHSNIPEDKIINQDCQKYEDIIEELIEDEAAIKPECEDPIPNTFELNEIQIDDDEQGVELINYDIIEESEINYGETEVIQEDDEDDDEDEDDEEMYTDTLDPEYSKKVITLFPEDIKPKSRKAHICDICGNHYNKRSALESHMKWHAQNKTSVCEICKKGFVTEFQLSRHMRTHTGERPYSCKYCARKFADISTKTKHERIHTNERPYKCDICPKAFNYSDVLRTHKMTHSGEKPFACDTCKKRFTQYHHLKAHLRTLLHKTNYTVAVQKS